MALDIISDSIVKLCGYIKPYPFLIYGAIGGFGLAFIIIISYTVVKNVYFTVIALTIMLFFLIYCGNLQSQAKIDDLQETKERLRRWK